MTFSTLPEPDLNALDAQLAAAEHTRWQTFYTDRARPCPFFVPHPDENLAQWLSEQRITPGRAIDLGCSNGRQADCGPHTGAPATRRAEGQERLERTQRAAASAQRAPDA